MKIRRLEHLMKIVVEPFSNIYFQVFMVGNMKVIEVLEVLFNALK